MYSILKEGNSKETPVYFFSVPPVFPTALPLVPVVLEGGFFGTLLFLLLRRASRRPPSTAAIAAAKKSALPKSDAAMLKFAPRDAPAAAPRERPSVSRPHDRGGAFLRCVKARVASFCGESLVVGGQQ